MALMIFHFNFQPFVDSSSIGCHSNVHMLFENLELGHESPLTPHSSPEKTKEPRNAKSSNEQRAETIRLPKEMEKKLRSECLTSTAEFLS